MTNNNNDNDNMLIFLDLTCGNCHHEEAHHQHHHQDQKEPNSTHDLAEIMIYAFVDDSPSVADLLWSKQQLNQGEFLKLTDEQEWSQLPTVDYSTHEPYFL